MECPEEYQDWPETVSVFGHHCASFLPFVSRQVSYPNALLPTALLAEARDQQLVDVACSTPASEFSGDALKANSVSMLEGFLAHQKGERHWVMDVPGLNLYLSQLSVQAVLSGRSWEDHWPPPLRCCDVHEANIWANINPVSSS
eukprot:CAMPEP_0114424410 /NCGR_PEP_ID=MMETSP0103-20121206/6678_1 /TAXON_ID=37642 ORGANISM="Paraphysomonas imperforata, Strain PA2" /NCGR_SAMPLE_ID=MMETSP0103 /ASSEMBLY_ACC=CAM_ASM_000201 /LENGTH=143 /DNA_ID=CAMNT_0001593159 /DNA_START=182 /DNA_END=609 /DNA_ORIENTATION=+